MAVDIAYEHVLARRSVRLYDQTPLDTATLGQVSALCALVEPLIPERPCHVLLRQERLTSEMVAVFGGYGRLITPPHFLVPYVDGGPHALTEGGFATEQLVIWLTALDIASCYIGSIANQPAARAQWGLASDASIGSLVIFGRPARAVRGLLNRAVRGAIGGGSRLPLARLYFEGSFDRPAAPPGPLLPLLEAGRRAPSARNTQPWRFLWHDGALHLYVRRHNSGYMLAQYQDYRYYDGGICMANIALAMRCLGRRGAWRLTSGPDNAPPCPPELEPLARLELA
ncbi:MAG: nitroreductase family protein [Chloroflexota bacterium]